MHTASEDEFSRYLRLRRMRPDAARYVRPDAERYLRPDRDRFLQPRRYDRDEGSDRAEKAADDAQREWLIEAAACQLRCELAALRVEVALLRFALGGRKAFNPNQPRVPAGNSDGGQWTSEGGQGGRVRVVQLGGSVTDADGQPYYKPGGHHEMPESVHKRWNLRPETRKIFENSTTGKLRIRSIQTTPDGSPRGNIWDNAHRNYNAAVQELSDRFMQTNNLKPESMTPDHARALLKQIRETNEPRIRHFNSNIRLLQRLFRTRTGRGTE